MAEEATADALGDGIEIESKPKKGMSGKKLVLFVILPILLLCGGAGGAYFGGYLDSLLGIGGSEAEIADQPEIDPMLQQGSAVFY